LIISQSRRYVEEDHSGDALALSCLIKGGHNGAMAGR
jgi:hypothetical protein